MPKSYASYPIKATSRAVSRKRARRYVWLAVGAAFSVGCVSSLTPFLPNISFETAQTEPQSQVAEALVAQAIPETAPVELVLPAPQETREEKYPRNLELHVTSGDTLVSMLTDVGVTHDEAFNIMEAAKKNFDPKKLTAGQNINVELDKAPDGKNPFVKSLTLPVSLTASLEIDRTRNDEFATKTIDKPLERKLAHAGGKINSSLYQTGSEIGLPSAMVGEIINAYSYDVDFQRDIHSGDTIDVLYEKLKTQDGKTAGTGNLIYAELNLGDETLKIFRYVDKSGNADFYNQAGESIRKALLKTPINGARISSGYGMRNHPILGYSKMHRGIDFAASTGTPIYAAGDATVEFVGRKGGYGNFLKLKHNDKYASAYAHLSRFASGIAPGKKVKQGQIVAYVGSTGSSTGPHLHYEILVAGNQVNPSAVKFKTGTVLKGKELAAFRQSMSKIEAKLEAAKSGKSDIAMADFERDIYSN